MTGLLEAVLPSIGVGLIFWFSMRAIVRADRNERNAVAALEAKDVERAARFSRDDSDDASSDPVAEHAQSSSSVENSGPDTRNS